MIFLEISSRNSIQSFQWKFLETHNFRCDFMNCEHFLEFDSVGISVWFDFLSLLSFVGSILPPNSVPPPGLLEAGGGSRLTRRDLRRETGGSTGRQRSDDVLLSVWQLLRQGVMARRLVEIAGSLRVLWRKLIASALRRANPLNCSSIAYSVVSFFFAERWIAVKFLLFSIFELLFTLASFC